MLPSRQRLDFVVVLGCFSGVHLSATPWTVAHQVPLSVEYSSKNTGVSCHRGASPLRDWTRVSWVSCIGRQILYLCTTWEAHWKKCIIIKRKYQIQYRFSPQMRYEWKQVAGKAGVLNLSSCVISNSSVQFSSVAQLCLTLCNPMDCSMPGLPVHHQLLELTQAHFCWVRDAIQPSHPLSSTSPLPSIFPSIRVFSNESFLHIRWPKYWIISFSISPSNEYSGLISFRIDWLDLLAVQGTLKSLLQHHSSKASILQCSVFFIVQLSHPYMITGKTIALTRQTFVGKVMSLLLNMLSRLVITFLPGSKRLLISWLQSLWSAVILEPKNIKSVTVSIVSPSICHEVMGLDAWS